MARIYRFFTKEMDSKDLEKSCSSDITFSQNLEPDILEQLVKVLRVKSGDEVILLPKSRGNDLEKFEYKFVINNAHKKQADLTFIEKTSNENELGFALELVLCLPNKPDKLALILQKATELGVNNIVLVESDFSQMKHSLREERLGKILKEAAEQSERAVVPTLEIKEKLSGFLNSYEGDGANLFVAMERKNGRKLSELINNVKENFGILVGPEGGFSDEEKEIISKKSFTCFSLGKRILRMETAAIVALGIATQK